MELLAYFLYILADWNICLLVPAIFAAIATFGLTSAMFAGAAAARARHEQGPVSLGRRINRIVLPFGSLLIFLGVISLVVLSIVSLIRPHLLDGYLISSIGERADAQVLSSEATNNLHNRQRVMRYHVIYKTKDGRKVETHFDSWDFNVYPSANTVRYPQVGDAFRVVYLPSFPSTFLILTDEDSEFTRKSRCKDLLDELDFQRRLVNFDPSDPDSKKTYDAAKAAAEENGCDVSAMGTEPSMHDAMER
jgi:hypothetical protein